MTHDSAFSVLLLVETGSHSVAVPALVPCVLGPKAVSSPQPHILTIVWGQLGNRLCSPVCYADFLHDLEFPH